MPGGGQYELIDADPHFKRVIKYMRTEDYIQWALSTVAGPLIITAIEKVEPTGRKFSMPSKRVLAAAGFIGCFSGFCMAYIGSTYRFWGWSENRAEVIKDRKEIKTLLSQGKNPYGKSELSPYLQDVASRYSTNSQLMLFMIPFFNFVNHQNHGIDLRKYYEVRPGEEKWGIGELPPLEEIEGLHTDNKYKKYKNY